MVNSKARNLNEFRRLLAYIMQNDNLQPLLTVQEAMNVAADLKLTTSPQQKKQKVYYMSICNIIAELFVLSHNAQSN